MFLRAGAISLVLLLASRLLGLVRESVQAAAFGATGLGDVAVLMLTLPDWVTGVLASGGLAYVLLPAWSRQNAGQVAASHRRAVHGLALAGCLLATLLALAHPLVLGWLLPGLANELEPVAATALLWSAGALPFALLAAVGAARLQHEGDFAGMYGANLVVNIVLIAVLAGATSRALVEAQSTVGMLGAGLLLAMAARLAWLLLRRRRFPRAAPQAAGSELPAAPVWFWAVAAAGLPLALPFAARSLASQEGPGALATFNYAWKLVELPLLLAVQLVATLALGPIARAFARAASRDEAAATTRRGFALAWTLACACAAGLLVAAPAAADLLFGWGRMQDDALAQVADWARVGAWGLLPQALTAIAVSVLAAQGRMHAPVVAYGAALLLLLTHGPGEGGELMLWLNWLWAGVCAASLWALRDGLRSWLPARALGLSSVALAVLATLLGWTGAPADLPLQFALGAVAALAVLGLTWAGSPDLRAALRR